VSGPAGIAISSTGPVATASVSSALFRCMGASSRAAHRTCHGSEAASGGESCCRRPSAPAVRPSRP
jgi:hypothetical protein